MWTFDFAECQSVGQKLLEKTEKGVALLDSKLPRWYRVVDITDLDMDPDHWYLYDPPRRDLVDQLGGSMDLQSKLGVEYKEFDNLGLRLAKELGAIEGWRGTSAHHDIHTIHTEIWLYLTLQRKVADWR